MYTIIIEGKIDKIYAPEGQPKSEELTLIGTFLNEIGPLAKHVKKSIEKGHGFNFMSVLLKSNNDKVTLSYIDDEDETWPQYTLPKDKFLQLLDHWNIVYKEPFPCIEMTLDDYNNITITVLTEES